VSVLQGVGTIKQILKAGMFYFALVFAAGFVLGTIRTLWIVPHVGVRTAELMETPIMFVVIIFAARWVARRLLLPREVAIRLGFGFVALGFLLITEFTLVLWLRSLTIREYIAGRDPLTGTVYLIMLGVFAFMPLAVARR
jgi:type IV secretory pathway TrbD component